MKPWKLPVAGGLLLAALAQHCSGAPDRQVLVGNTAGAGGDGGSAGSTAADAGTGGRGSTGATTGNSGGSGSATSATATGDTGATSGATTGDGSSTTTTAVTGSTIGTSSGSTGATGTSTAATGTTATTGATSTTGTTGTATSTGARDGGATGGDGSARDGGTGGAADAARDGGTTSGVDAARDGGTTSAGGSDGGGRDGSTGPTTGGGGGPDASPEAAVEAAADAAPDGDGSIPCLQLLTTPAALTAATAGLTVTQEDFSRDAAGAPVQYIVQGGDNYFTHASVTLQSFATSDQADAGTVSNYVVGHPGTTTSVSSIIGSYDGFDGLRSNFTSPEVVVGMTGNVGAPDGFAVVVRRSDTAQITTFMVTSTTTVFAGVQSHCGAVISSVDLSPNPVVGGSHMSVYWAMTNLTFAR